MSDDTQSPSESPAQASKPVADGSSNLFALTSFINRAASSVTTQPVENAQVAPKPILSASQALEAQPAKSVRTKSPNPLDPGLAEDSKSTQAFAKSQIQFVDADGEAPTATASDQSVPRNAEQPVHESDKPFLGRSVKDRFKFKKAVPTKVAIPQVNDEHIQKNNTPKWVAASVALVVAVLSFAAYKQHEVDRIADESAKRAIASSKATASTLGSGFISTSNSIPITSSTAAVPIVEAVATPQKPPDGLPADGDARYRKMLDVIQNQEVISPAANVSPKKMPVEPAAYTPPSALKKPPPSDPKTVPMMVEGAMQSVIDDKEQVINPAPAIYSDVARASSDVPYLVAKIDAAGPGSAYVYHAVDRTGAWLSVGDSLEGGYTVIAIRPYAVVVLDSAKRPKTLRMVK